ncbi:GNAT family N-acetyltransferase [Nocardioides montaniterrae]
MSVETLRARVLLGAEAVAALRGAAVLIDARSAEFCTSSAFLVAAAELLPTTPTVLVVERRGEVVAVAPLAIVRRWPVTRVGFLGGEHVDYCRFFAVDDAAARVLGDALADWLGTLRVWALDLAQLDPADATLARLAGRLSAELTEGPPMPRIEDLPAYAIGRTWRKHVSSAANRLRADGRVGEDLVVATPAELDRWLPRIVAVRRERDHGQGRRSQLDDPAVLAFYERVVREAVAAARCRIHLQVVDGEIGGFSTIMIDGDIHRIFDGRVAEHLQRYKGGITTSVRSVQDAVASGARTYDWLRGESAVKFANAEVRRTSLGAVSHPLVRTIDEVRADTRSRLKAIVPRELLQQARRVLS